MPNHVEQDLWVSGPVEDIKCFMEFATEDVRGEEHVLSANKFLPYPEKFKKLDEEAKSQRDAGNYTFKDGFNSGGYEWCCLVWGTKWGIYEAVRSVPTSFGKRKKGTVRYTFQSAWSPATKIVLAMSTQFPTLNFKLKYYECGMQFKGIFIVQGGNIIEDSSSKYSGHRGG